MIPARVLPQEFEAQPAAAARQRQRRNQRRLQSFLRNWVLLMGLGILVVSRFGAMANAGYKVDRLAWQVGQAKAQDDQLEAQVQALGSAERLAVAAWHQGLVTPGQLVVIGRTARVATPEATQKPQAWQVAWSQLSKGMASLLGEL